MDEIRFCADFLCCIQYFFPPFYMAYILVCSQMLTMSWAQVGFFLRLLLVLSSSFWLLLLLLSFLLLLPSRVQNWDALVSKGEKKEKRYQLAKQSAKIRTTTNNSNSNNNTYIYIYIHVYIYILKICMHCSYDLYLKR